jgi:hypothetical protein
MSDSNVTIKLDSRLFYGLVAVLAVLGIFGIGWFLGNQIGGDAVAPAAQPVANNAAVNVAPVGGAADTTGLGAAPAPGQVDPGAIPQQPAVTSKPVSVEDVPVEEGQPRIWVDEVADTNWIYDFGEIPAQEATERDFVVSNVGQGVLVIESASASCGCTAAVVADSELDPGDTTTIRVSYDPRVNGEQGKFVSKQVRIKSNDPLAPLVEFTVQADVATQ